jgi:cation-transporting ATPase 13A1
VYPWVYFVYPLWGFIYLKYYDAVLGSAEATFLSLVALFSAHALTFLATEWSVTAKAKLTCAQVPPNFNFKQTPADIVIRLIPKEHSGSGALCPIEYRQISSDTTEANPILPCFTFQKQIFVWDYSKKVFRELDYPIGLTVGEYQKLALQNFDQEANLIKYGKNIFDIPLPTFWGLFREHAVAPFFVFQVFCVCLWALDEYWYYSLFTLMMLFVFESTIVGQRLRTLKEFRSMVHPPYDVYVRREGKWVTISSEDILPHDVISIPRGSKDEHVVPCDVVLIEGGVVVNEAMLSGESTPLHKESIQERATEDVIHDENGPLSSESKHHMVFSGTKVVQATAAESTPDSGALGVVVRTGFGTTQGKLVRMMVFSRERVSANNVESFLFIGFLLIFAVQAAAYLWIKGQEHGRPPSKLLLDCILIVTSVIPPELPMELSMAVNASLVALARLAIFCTEPFRIPLAGKLDILCFDKTGTITSEDLVLEGVHLLGGRADDTSLKSPVECPSSTLMVLAASHSLVKVDNAVIGDPLERATVTAAGFELSATDQVIAHAEHVPLGLRHIRILRKFAFSSALKRMATVARVMDNTTRTSIPNIFVAIKGAPEVIKSMLKVVPEHYDEVYQSLARNGGRVLALAYKAETESLVSRLSQIDRHEIEKNLVFAGFVVFSCPLKPDSKDALVELNQAGHRCVMITGDAALTACHVARQVNIVHRPCYILDADEENSPLLWRAVSDSSKSIPMKIVDVPKLVEKYDLCVTGKALLALGAQGMDPSPILPYVYVWARVSPAQKEWVLAGLKLQGYTTLMCGDGTNDVGALKQAHVGVALLDASQEDLQKIAEHAQYTRMRAMYDKQVELTKKWGAAAPPMPSALQRLEAKRNKGRKEPAKPASQPAVTSGKPSNENLSAAELRQRKQKEMMQSKVDKLSETLMNMEVADEPPTLQFGDASVAAPFTSKLGTLLSITNIVKQGRCTLVTTLQMYKILALNCLISAYSLSVLFLEGMKWGDWQMTIHAMLMAACFLCISKGSPLKKLAPSRPLATFFNTYAILSVVSQFAVHAASLYYVTEMCKAESLEDAQEIDFEGKREFSPNLLNSGIYLLSSSMQVSTFAINYIGRPFRESISENWALSRGLLLVASGAFIAALEWVPDLNSWLQLVPFPSGVSEKLVIVMALDFGLAWGLEKGFHFLFARTTPRSELRITFGEN